MEDAGLPNSLARRFEPCARVEGQRMYLCDQHRVANVAATCLRDEGIEQGAPHTQTPRLRKDRHPADPPRLRIAEVEPRGAEGGAGGVPCERMNGVEIVTVVRIDLLGFGHALFLDEDEAPNGERFAHPHVIGDAEKLHLHAAELPQDAASDPRTQRHVC